MKKKVNPARIPVSKRDVEKAKNEAIQIAVARAYGLFFLAVRDLYGYGPRRMMRVWDRVNSYSEDIIAGTFDLEEALQTLETECGIRLI